MWLCNFLRNKPITSLELTNIIWPQFLFNQLSKKIVRKLTSFKISDTKISKDDIDYLIDILPGNLEKLQIISLESIVDKFYVDLKKFKNLEYIWLENLPGLFLEDA